ncbi:hypothetical protein [Sphingobacterium sp. SYP-B4668]|uniref:hypothetical protein n=1 Tax=Sphingobacterium sp. SYP-B4668 TaxID=2996035 RepID=UPI0022DD161C|nr:hypothetical protein [Sphingobacterium sp. SYP-B4668]
MKAIIYLVVIVVFSACSSNKKHDDKQMSFCSCEKEVEKDSVIFATNVRVKEGLKGRNLRFNCAAIETGIASISDENGRNEREKFIYDIGCVATTDQSLELSQDFKYFAEEMQSQKDFLYVIHDNQKLVFEFRMEGTKIISISKLNMEQ